MVKGYLSGDGRTLASSSELAIVKFLQFAGIDYDYKKEMLLKDGSRVTPTFTTNKGVIIADESSTNDIKGTISRIIESYPEMKVLVLSRTTKSDSIDNLGTATLMLNPDSNIDTKKTEAIFLDDPSFAFDYSHILPWTKKCSVLHGHTSAILLEVIGHPRKGMIVDFGDVKRIVRDAVKALDHKLFISDQYLIESDERNYRVRFDGPNGEFDLKVPKSSAFILPCEATIENMADVVLDMIASEMPSNVTALGVYIYEGLNKGSHILASINSME